MHTSHRKLPTGRWIGTYLTVVVNLLKSSKQLGQICAYRWTQTTSLLKTVDLTVKVFSDATMENRPGNARLYSE